VAIAVKEYVQGHYEVLDQSYGKVYKWVPAQALIECECGQLLTIQESIDSCQSCQADYTEVVRELGDKLLLTENAAYYSTHREYEEWMEGEEEHLPDPKSLYSWGLFSGLARKDEINRIVDILYGS